MRCSRRLHQMLPMIVPEAMPWTRRQRYCTASSLSQILSSSAFSYSILSSLSLNSVYYLCPSINSCYRSLWMSVASTLWFVNCRTPIILVFIYLGSLFPCAAVMMFEFSFQSVNPPNDASYIRAVFISHLFPR